MEGLGLAARHSEPASVLGRCDPTRIEKIVMRAYLLPQSLKQPRRRGIGNRNKKSARKQLRTCLGIALTCTVPVHVSLFSCSPDVDKTTVSTACRHMMHSDGSRSSSVRYLKNCRLITFSAHVPTTRRGWWNRGHRSEFSEGSADIGRSTLVGKTFPRNSSRSRTDFVGHDEECATHIKVVNRIHPSEKTVDTRTSQMSDCRR